jgi:DNA-binding transcriptional regulator LsrR (DeoR family)
VEADADSAPVPAPVDMISEIVARYAAGDTQAQIAKAFGLSQPKVSKILQKARKK